MTELRRRMIEDMELHGLAQGTQEAYVGVIRRLARHFKRPPDQLSENDIRAFIGYLTKTRRFAHGTIQVYQFAIKFFYGKTLNREWPVLNADFRKPRTALNTTHFFESEIVSELLLL
ncbi:unnamed protein product [marine sediment metagenome]|uniref:Core-binding (CB) domain-containing protein n=1 Tax=marine sediment metagenome TaxID=412755 RepID=X0Y5K8_9ZZZZ